ncbi:hypothetical protein C2E23DRAFT_509106 [Lenzites betulinus]|nr:hypothetical protein C2E23DRAFT_509106 [Lenzites betulinus]
MSCCGPSSTGCCKRAAGVNVAGHCARNARAHSQVTRDVGEASLLRPTLTSFHLPPTSAHGHPQISRTLPCHGAAGSSRPAVLVTTHVIADASRSLELWNADIAACRGFKVNSRGRGGIAPLAGNQTRRQQKRQTQTDHCVASTHSSDQSDHLCITCVLSDQTWGRYAVRRVLFENRDDIVYENTAGMTRHVRTGMHEESSGRRSAINSVSVAGGMQQRRRPSIRPAGGGDKGEAPAVAVYRTRACCLPLSPSQQTWSVVPFPPHTNLRRPRQGLTTG